MSNWRDSILREFAPNVSRLTLVADPDGLLLEEGILQGIRERGFELIPFEDHVAFRFAYESKFRTYWDQGRQTDLVVVLRSPESDLSALPYDLLQTGRRLSFNLGEIFPHLSYPVITALNREDLDLLYEAQQKHAPGPLGDNATKEFVLRQVYAIAPELIKQPTDLFRVLLRRHYLGQRLPAILDERFIQLLRHNGALAAWPLEIIVPDREAFFAFLQERWPLFLDQLTGEVDQKFREEEAAYLPDQTPIGSKPPGGKPLTVNGLTITGPRNLPFDHQDIRVYIDTLFLEGLLHPVDHLRGKALEKTWAHVGIRINPVEDRSRRLRRLLEAIRAAIPKEEARHGEWLHFARGWAEMTVLAQEQEGVIDGKSDEGRRDLQEQVDSAFTSWLGKRYAGLINLPPNPPVMVHHLLRFLPRFIVENPQSKIALVVIDGLALDQWLVIGEVLARQRPDLRLRESTLFAWIPSITSISRQAIFAGKPPFFFPNSIQTTDKEPSLWAQFWTDQGLSANGMVYLKGLGAGSLEGVEEALAHPRRRVAGLVIDKVDKIIHGMELGTAGMHNQVRQWANQTYLSGLLNLLFDRGFQVYLTSDHGNIEAEGCGRPSEGAVADLRGERVRLYSDGLLREKVQERFPAAIAWPPIGLPDNCLPLIAPHRQAFIRAGERAVSHGGLSIEELIIPFVQIERLGQ
jgi:hypothetical protein